MGDCSLNDDHYYHWSFMGVQQRIFGRFSLKNFEQLAIEF